MGCVPLAASSLPSIADSFRRSVPKFFRWLSERYPAISQLIAENRIPEFDCLYVRCPIPPVIPLRMHADRRLARHEWYHP